MKPVALSVIFLAAFGALAQESDIAELRRPLELPTLSASAQCPASIGTVGLVPIEARVFGRPPGVVWFGTGPVYIQGWYFLDEGVRFQRTLLSGDATEPYGFHFKTIVVSDVAYGGPILVRGRELETGREMTFSGDENELILSGRWRYQRPSAWGGNPDNWRYWAEIFEWPEPGCYGIQIDTLVDSEVLIIALPHLPNSEDTSMD